MVQIVLCNLLCVLVRFFHLLISVFVAKQSHSVSAALPVRVYVWERRSREEEREREGGRNEEKGMRGEMRGAREGREGGRKGKEGERTNCIHIY